MLKIGFADYYLNNWHCDHYPGFLREVIKRDGYDAEITHAFGIHGVPPDEAALPLALQAETESPRDSLRNALVI